MVLLVVMINYPSPSYKHYVGQAHCTDGWGKLDMVPFHIEIGRSFCTIGV